MKIILFFTCVLFTGKVRAQILKVSAGTDLTILGGTIFKADSLTLTPTADFIISNNEIIKSDTISHTSLNDHIFRVYQFTNTTNPFTGSIQFEYTDGTELNGIPEGSLTLNVHNGTYWSAYPAATRDATNNFVLTTGLSAINLNELTLANSLTPLPLIWLSFTVTKQNQTALLQWTTAQEHNTRNFAIEQSRNGINWTGIATLPAAGNSIITNYYSYVHTTPVRGINYYRILQTDLDNRNSYSDIKTLRFTTTDEIFTIQVNPVNNNVLTVQVYTATGLAFYTTDGKLLWQQRVNAGTTYIDVSRYAKGAYLLKANSTTQKVLIQ